MKGAAGALLLVLPSLARAEGTIAQQYSFLSSFLQMLAALAVVIGLILISRHFSGRLLKLFPAGGRYVSKYIRLIETRYISPKKSLILIEVGGEYLLLSDSGDHLTLIKQVDMLEEAETVEADHTTNRGFSRLFQR